MNEEMLSMEIEIEEQSQGEVMTEQEWTELQSLNQEEVMEKLNLEKVELFQGLEEILQKKTVQARKIVDFLKESYPEQLMIMLTERTLEIFLDQRVEEAKEYFLKNHKIMQDKENVWGMDTMQRIRTEQQISATLWEIIDKEILFKPIPV